MAARKIRPIRIEGNLAYVPLTKGYEAVIDAADVPLVAGSNWYASMECRRVYAKRRKTSGHKAHRIVSMHRTILDAPDDMLVDHKDGNGLNNRRKNLRLATATQNACNKTVQSNSASGLKGVVYHPETKKWRARIFLDGKTYSLGLHRTPEDAHRAYTEASGTIHGEFGRAV